MRTLSNRRGEVSGLAIALVLFIVLFIGAAGFGVWAFMQRAYYKDHSDKEAAAAAAKAADTTRTEEAAKYAEAIKQPYSTYTGPSAFGNITVNYPRTWSAYVVESENSSTPISAYMHPKIVPSVSDPENAFALRVELVQSPYDTVLNQYRSYVQTQKAAMQPYALPKVPTAVGARVEGQISAQHKGVVIILPLRNLTLKVWTDSLDFKADLDTHVLPNLTFNP